MQIQFAPRTADTGVLVIPVEKDGLGRIAFEGLAEVERTTILGAARSARFEGEAGAIAEAFVANGGDGSLHMTADADFSPGLHPEVLEPLKKALGIAPKASRPRVDRGRVTIRARRPLKHVH